MDESQTVAIYARISEDPSGEAAGVNQQIGDARQMAEQRGWAVGGVYSDNDISALNGKARPGYAQLMRDAATGDFSRIVVFHTSRLWRNRIERANGIKALADHRVSIAAVKGPELDLSSAYGRGMAGLIGEFDTMESEVKSERIRAAANRRAKEGRAAGAVSYGWTRTYDTESKANAFKDDVDAVAAAVVRSIVDALLSGKSLRSVTKDLNDRSVPTPSAYLGHREGGAERWLPSTVKKIALRPSNAALRLHHRGRPDQALFPAAWPALISTEQYEAVTGLFQPGQLLGRAGAFKHLLTGGVGRCGVCDGVLRTAPKGKPGAKVSLYQCTDNACVGRNEAHVDALVRSVVLARMSRPDFAEVLHAAQAPDHGPEREEVAALRVKLDEATESYLAGRLSIGQLETVTGRLTPSIAKLERVLAERSNVPTGLLEEIAGADTGALAALWDGWEVAQRRRLLTLLGMRVVILKTTRGPGFKPESVRIDWEGQGA